MPTKHYFAHDISEYLDDLLEVKTTPDYPPAMNGLQCTNQQEITKVAAAVDFSIQTANGAARQDANFMIVHHGMFWSGIKPLVGPQYAKIRALLDNDIALYSVHVPLDRHPVYGNNVLLAEALDLKPTGEFARYKDISIGVSGQTEMETTELFRRATLFAQAHGGNARSTPILPGQMTVNWGLCTGSGASSETLREASEMGIDTLIVGEGPHHTAVEAMELGIAVIYAGHYATETLGVRKLAQHVAEKFGIEFTFVEAPTTL